MCDFKIAISVTGKNSINYWISTEFQRNHITKTVTLITSNTYMKYIID